MLNRSGFCLGVGVTLIAARPTDAQTTPLIRFGTAPNDAAAEAYFAADTGLFKRRSLSVQVSSFATGAAIAEAVVGGSLDVGGHNVLSFATAFAKNIPLKLLAAEAIYSSDAPTTLLCVAKTSPIAKAKDLEGKTIAVLSLGDITYVAAAAWLEQSGADLSTVKFVEIPFPQAPASLERGTVDAAMVAEPSLSAGVRSGTIRPLARAYDAIGKRFVLTLTFSTVDWVRAQPDVASRLTSTMYEVGRWANVRSHQSESAGILARYAKVDQALIEATTRATFADRVDPGLFQPPLDAAFRYKLLSRPVSAAELLRS